MSEDAASNPPRSFYVISSVALAWNLVGVMLYVMQVTMSDEVLSAMDPAQRAYVESTPSWLIAVYAWPFSVLTARRTRSPSKKR